MTQRTIRMIIRDQEPVTAPATITVRKAADLMKESRVGALLVVNDGKLAGIFTERDALFRVIAGGHDANTTPISAVMTANPKTIHPDKPFAYALYMMHEGSFRHVPVVEDGRPIGMVSARDALGPELEAFVYELLRQEQVSEILA
jgi:CBS domain-containing protein